jgi:hypothetical protein
MATHTPLVLDMHQELLLLLPAWVLQWPVAVATAAVVVFWLLCSWIRRVWVKLLTLLGASHTPRFARLAGSFLCGFSFDEEEFFDADGADEVCIMRTRHSKCSNTYIPQWCAICNLASCC